MKLFVVVLCLGFVAIALMIATIISKARTIVVSGGCGVKATVLDKVYMSGKHEKYLVTIRYKDMVQTIDSISFYKDVKIGEEVEVTLYRAYNKNNKCLVKELQAY